MSERRVVLAPGVGLHARPAAMFVRAATAQPVGVRIRIGDGAAVDAASILGVLSLGANGGDEVILEADGEGADAALDELARLLGARPSAPGEKHGQARTIGS